MYGLHVHQAAIDFGVRISGCTVHFVDNEYDHGPILLQVACPVFPEDTAVLLRKGSLIWNAKPCQSDTSVCFWH